MTEDEKKEMLQVLSKVLDAHRGVDSKTHEAHHRYIETEIDRRSDALHYWQSVRKQITGWSIIVLLTGIGYGVADYAHYIFTHLIKR